jgi:hypothetical protein
VEQPRGGLAYACFLGKFIRRYPFLLAIPEYGVKSLLDIEFEGMEDGYAVADSSYRQTAQRLAKGSYPLV